MHSFDNRTISISEFSSCVTTGGRLCQSCSVLQNDSSRDFQHSKQCKYKEKYLSKFSKAHKRKQTSLLAKVNSRLFFSYFRPPCWCPSEGHQHGVSIQSSINLCGILCQITRVRKTVQTWDLDRVHIYLSSITCRFLVFIHWMVFYFDFDGVTVKTGNSCHFDKTELKIMIFVNFQVYHRNEKNFESSYGLGGRHLKIRDVCQELIGSCVCMDVSRSITWLLFN